MWIKPGIHLWILTRVSHELFNMQIRWDSTVNLKITCEFLHVWIHVWKISLVTSCLKYWSLLKWLTYLLIKGPIIRDIYVTYRGSIGLTHSSNIGKSCDLQAYLAYTCNILKEHWDFRHSIPPPPKKKKFNPPPPPPIFFSQHPTPFPLCILLQYP